MDLEREPAQGGHGAWAGRGPARFYAVYAACLTLVLVYLSEYISFRDQGDFARAVGGMLQFPEGGIGKPSQMQWYFRPEGFFPIAQFDMAAYAFRALGYGARAFSGSMQLWMVSIPAKLLVAAGIHLLASAYARPFRARYSVQAVAFGCLAVAVFQAHNVGMLKSFYSEVLFFVFFIALLAGMVGWPRKGSGLLVVVAAVGAGLSKTQYFYLPLLVSLCLLAVHWRRSCAVPWRLAAWLLAGQLVCVLPALHNPYAQLNYHHSTYFGSYLVQTPAQLKALGLTPRQQACVGIDGFGVRADGPGGSRPYRKGISCYGDSKQRLRDVLAPYWHDPLTLWRLAVHALPAHFTVGYFHVFRDLFYVTPAGDAFGPGAVLLQVTAWREHTVTRWAVPLLLAGLVLAWRLRKTQDAMLAAPILFLAAFAMTQAAIALVGEGIRDLSKHLWAAQLALDLLVVALLGQVGLWVASYRARARESLQRRTAQLP